ncbi:uncharacterized protein METZ01_LOCUS348035, partial [marine metagenome]
PGWWDLDAQPAFWCIWGVNVSRNRSVHILASYVSERLRIEGLKKELLKNETRYINRKNEKH